MVNSANSFHDFKMVGRNLYFRYGIYYKLHGTGITPNGCWVINPKMVELVDVDVPTGQEVWGQEIVIHDIAGTVPAQREYIRYNPSIV